MQPISIIGSGNIQNTKLTRTSSFGNRSFSELNREITNIQGATTYSTRICKNIKSKCLYIVGLSSIFLIGVFIIPITSIMKQIPQFPTMPQMPLLPQLPQIPLLPQMPQDPAIPQMPLLPQMPIYSTDSNKPTLITIIISSNPFLSGTLQPKPQP